MGDGRQNVILSQQDLSDLLETLQRIKDATILMTETTDLFSEHTASLDGGADDLDLLIHQLEDRLERALSSQFNKAST